MTTKTRRAKDDNLTYAEKVAPLEELFDAPADPDTSSRPGHARAKVFSVRLNPEELDALNAFAEAAEVPASALVRGWILKGLRKQDEDPLDQIQVSVMVLRTALSRLPRELRESLSWAESPLTAEILAPESREPEPAAVTSKKR
jgi:hypothetical protein